ncbi:MAG: FHA domain-containing protein, partial [Anaerolineales bacterium]|nr:FHA domain-containing protein [Anaerolineales bacterium]
QEYNPTSQQLKVIIEFPDGHPRPLEKTSLEVDGEIVQSNTAPPFDRFSWDLSEYEGTRVHYLRVLVEDHLGLSQTSVKTPVNVVVNKPELTLRNIIKQYPVGLASLGGILIAAFTLLILISKGVIYPKSLLPAISSNTKDREFHRRQKGHQQERPYSSQRSLTQKKADQKGNPKAYAVLHSYNQEAKAIYTHGLPISSKEENFGRNPHQTTILVDHPSVSGLHARLSVKSNTEFQLSDEGSQAGTWVNFQEIPEKYPVSIQDGDIIHFGKIGFQFRSTKPGPEREITITEENSQ